MSDHTNPQEQSTSELSLPIQQTTESTDHTTLIDITQTTMTDKRSITSRDVINSDQINAETIVQTHGDMVSGDKVGGDVVYGDKVAGDKIIYQHVAPPHNVQEQRNRSRMLQKVRDFWVKGVLEQSLHGAALLALGLERRPDAVEHTWDLLVQPLDQAPHSLPHGTPIVEVFDTFGGEVLILGEPGAGKTTTLLELARDLIDRAEQDESHPMPVVFNLSSWAAKHPPLAQWLVDELNMRYDVPHKVARAWMEADQVLPLLDGLDEVLQTYRRACVEAINAFRKDHGLINIVVCSRLADYEALTTRLRLQGAIMVQPLTMEQIDTYLESAGEQLTGLRTALAEDAELRDLAESPLMLSIMILAYQGQPSAALVTEGAPEDRRRHMFAAYVARMFQRRGVAQRYSREQTMGWLIWLAREMAIHKSSVFLIEQLQPNWFPTSAQLWYYTIIDRLGGGLIIGCLGLLIGGLFSRAIS